MNCLNQKIFHCNTNLFAFYQYQLNIWIKKKKRWRINDMNGPLLKNGYGFFSALVQYNNVTMNIKQSQILLKLQ